ncbi:hypothetical protein TrVE_jg1161 [Triparma verrucosa]|uniref:ApaG domain-containing protein n=1 Tax=Triparma verrucosa TaxID=1606542 RepID=A0A9W7F8P5_9STRA|nr:hypothetical protein TrVE_jg1161 [Triparma verrucosa]
MPIALHSLPVLHSIILYASPTPFLSVLSKEFQQWWKEYGDSSVSSTFLQKKGLKITKRNGSSILIREVVDKFKPSDDIVDLNTYLNNFDFHLYVSLIKLYSFFETSAQNFPAVADCLSHKMGSNINSIIPKILPQNLTLTSPSSPPPVSSSILIWRLLTSYTSSPLTFRDQTSLGNLPLISSPWGSYIVYNHCIFFHPLSSSDPPLIKLSGIEYNVLLYGKGSSNNQVIIASDPEGTVYRLHPFGGNSSRIKESDNITTFVKSYFKNLELGILNESKIIQNMSGINLNVNAVIRETSGIKVGVKCFLAHENPQMGFVYCVSIWSDEIDFHGWKLTYRNWVFEDEVGNEETVRGEGVIGMFPEIRGGRRHVLEGEEKEGKFWYWSCTGPREGGKMGGWIEFERGGGQTLKANVGEVTLDRNNRVFS